MHIMTASHVSEPAWSTHFIRTNFLADQDQSTSFVILLTWSSPHVRKSARAKHTQGRLMKDAPPVLGNENLDLLLFGTNNIKEVMRPKIMRGQKNLRYGAVQPPMMESRSHILPQYVSTSSILVHASGNYWSLSGRSSSIRRTSHKPRKHGTEEEETPRNKSWHLNTVEGSNTDAQRKFYSLRIYLVLAKGNFAWNKRIIR